MAGYPRTYEEWMDLWREWALEKKNATSIMRKADFRPGVSGEAPPTPILSLEGARRTCMDPTDVFPGFTNFAITASAAYGWGSNFHNQMGRTGTDYADEFLTPTTTATSVADPVAFSGIEAGAAAVGSDGTAYLSGYPYESEIAFGSFVAQEDAPEAEAVVSGRAATFAAGYGNHYFLATDGTVWGTGPGMVGINPLDGSTWWSLASQTGPDGFFQMPTDLVFDVVQIASAGGRFCFLRDTGEVGTWAAGEAEPTYPPDCPSGITKLAACSGTLYALSGDGEIWATGANGNGQRGDGTFDFWDFGQFTSGAFTQTLGGPYVDVAGAQQDGFAVDEDGKLYSWGAFGPPLGLGAVDSLSAYAEPQQIGVAEDWTHCYGSWHAPAAMAKNADSCLWAWGDNGAGWVGAGYTSEAVYEPVRVLISSAYPAWPIAP